MLALLLVLALFSAALQVLSVAAVMPFLAVAADPTQINQVDSLFRLQQIFGSHNSNAFLIALGVIALLLLVVSNASMAVYSWAQTRYCLGCIHSLGMRLLQLYASTPYVFYLSRNSADLTKNILTEADQVATGVIMPVLDIFARGLFAIAIVCLLIFVDPLLATIVATFLGGAYLAIFVMVRLKLIALGESRLIANTARFKALNEFFGAIKAIKILGNEAVFIRHFEGPSARYCRNRSHALIIAQLPRYFLEILAFGGILLIAIYLIDRDNGFQEILPILGTYAFAGYRLMPSLQQIFNGFTMITFHKAALRNMNHEINDATCARQRAVAYSSLEFNDAGNTLSFPAIIELNDVTFTYPGANTASLSDINIKIEPNTTIGFVGKTGAGKTTVVDLILGLLVPQSGEIRVGGVLLSSENIAAWKLNFGYVPQRIYLTDDTVASNIGLGVPQTKIRMDAVRTAAEIANIDQFVSEELPQGYETVIGEHGVRLSGGQQQRIGIARALYHDPDILVFDEATSALDNETEAAVMEAMQRLAGKRTILIVAHRLSTVQFCDIVYEMDGGKIIASNSPATNSHL